MRRQVKIREDMGRQDKGRKEKTREEKRSFRVNRRTTLRLRRREHEGPSSRWTLERDISHTTINSDWATPLRSAPPRVSVTRQARATPARTAGFMVSVPALRRTHTGHTATVLQLPWTLMLSLCAAFLPFPLLSDNTHWLPTHANYMDVFVSMRRA